MNSIEKEKQNIINKYLEIKKYTELLETLLLNYNEKENL